MALATKLFVLSIIAYSNLKIEINYIPIKNTICWRGHPYLVKINQSVAEGTQLAEGTARALNSTRLMVGKISQACALR